MKRIFLSLCFAAIACTAVTAQTSANLRFNPEKDKVYRFKSTSDQTITQTINGNQQTTQSNANYVVSLKAIDETSEFIVLEVHIDTMTTKTNTMGKVMILSSTSESDIKSGEMADVISNVMNKISKNVIFARVDRTGKVNDIPNLKMLSDMILKDTSNITITGQLGTAVRMQIKNLTELNTYKTIIEMVTHHLPAKQVAKAESWNISDKLLSGGMNLDILTSYHLDKISENIASITSESNIKAAENAQPLESGGAKVTYDDLKGLSKTGMSVDVNTGLIIKDESKTHITGNLGVTVPGMNMQIPMDIDGVAKTIALQ